MATNTDEIIVTDNMTANEMSSNIIGLLFKNGLAAYEVNFIFYIDFFVETTFKILNKEQLKEKEFLDYVSPKQQKTDDKHQKYAIKIYKMLQNREKWTKRKDNFIKLESLLLRYEFSRNAWKEKVEKSAIQNAARHKEDRALTKYILDLYHEEPKQKVKSFYNKNEMEIKKFIEKNCPKLHEKIETDADYDLFDRIRKIIYKRNQKDNKNILSLQLEEHSN